MKFSLDIRDLQVKAFNLTKTAFLILGMGLLLLSFPFTKSYSMTYGNQAYEVEKTHEMRFLSQKPGNILGHKIPNSTHRPDTFFEDVKIKKLRRDRRTFLVPEYKLKKSSHRDNKPHAIFLIHGLLGSESTWGHLEHILKKTFYPYKNIKIKNLTYPTSNNNLTDQEFRSSKNLDPIKFGKILSSKIISFLVEEGLQDLKSCVKSNPDKENDLNKFINCLNTTSKGFTNEGFNFCQQQIKLPLPSCALNAFNVDSEYSIIVHSQGGLSIASYLNSCYLSQETNTESKFCNYEEAIDIYDSITEKPLWSYLEPPQKKEAKKANTRARGPFKNTNNPLKTYDIKDLLLNRHLKNNVRTPKNLKNLISLGAPFWGSPTANYAQELFLDLDLLQLGPFAFEKYNFLGLLETVAEHTPFPFPIKQINRLAIGSAGLEWQRGLMLNIKKMKNKITGGTVRGLEDWGPDVEFQRRYPNDLKVYNVAGVITQFENLKQERKALKAEINNLSQKLYDYGSSNSKVSAQKLRDRIQKLTEQLEQIEGGAKESIVNFATQSSEYENDLIVGAPEARLDFIYNIENPLEGGLPLTGMTNMTTEYLVTHNSHININQNTLPIAGIWFDEMDKNPSWDIIKNVFEREFGFKSPRQSIRSTIKDKLVDQIRNFTSEVKLLTPQGYQRRFYINPEKTLISAENPRVFSKLKLENRFYIQAYGYNQSDERISKVLPQTFFHIGKVEPAYALKPKIESIEEYKSNLGQLGHVLNYRFDVLGFLPKKLSQSVLPGVNSYAEAYLTPYHPIAPNPIQQLGTLVGSLALGHGVTRSFYLNQLGTLEAIDSSDPPATPICHIGLMGNSAPPKFRFKSPFIEDYLEGEDREAFPNSIVVRNFSASRFLKDNDITDRWFWYSPHRSLELLNFNQSETLSNDFRAAEQLQREPGTLYEVIGRATIGFTDPRYGFGRQCDTAELKADKELCSQRSIDRYLVTSPEIRSLDGVRLKDVGLDLNSVFLKGNDRKGHHFLVPKGLRWVNVKDIDLFQPAQKVPYIPQQIFMGQGARPYLSHTPGNHCLLSDDKNRYLDQGQYRDLFFYKYNLKEN